MSDRARAALAGPIMDEIAGSDRAEGLLSAAADPLRRAALLALLEEGPLTAADLAESVAAGERSDSPVSGNGRTVTALHHNHLPRLADAGLVELERREDRLVVHPDDGLSRDALESVEEVAERDGGEEVLSLLTDPTRRQLVRELGSATAALELDELAATLAADDGADPDCAAVESARVSLHHVHLPRLEAAGVVKYDTDAGRVSPGDLPGSFLDQHAD